MRLGRWLVLVIALLAIGSMFVTGCTRAKVKSLVAESAKAYCDDLGMDFIGGSSTGVDSDGDGYVAIDARCKDRTDEKVTLLNLECSYSYVGWTTGCKERAILKHQNNG